MLYRASLIAHVSRKGTNDEQAVHNPDRSHSCASPSCLRLSGSLNMPLLYALRLSCAVADVRYRIEGNIVTVYKLKKTDGPTAANNRFHRHRSKPRFVRLEARPIR
jgi:hypothetical protein